MRDNVMDGIRHAKFLSIGSRVSGPQIRDVVGFLGWLVFLGFFGSFIKATAYTPKRIGTQSTLEHVVPCKEVPFGGLDDYIWYIDPGRHPKCKIL